MDKTVIRKLMDLEYDIKGKNTDGTYVYDVESARNRVVGSLARGKMRNYTREEVEDAFMDAMMYAYERCKIDEKYAKDLSVSSVTWRTRGFAQRHRFRNEGYTQRGDVPKAGRGLHIQNRYDEHGENVIDKLGYDEDGNLIQGT